MIYGYIRVSTDKQSVESQKNAISRYCIDNKLMIDEWFSIQISTSKHMEKRLVTELINKLVGGDTIIVTEMSRLGRSMSELFYITDNVLNTKKARIISLNPFMDLNATNVNDIENIIKVTVVKMMSQIEKSMTSERTKEGLRAAKAKGVKLGSQKGKPKKSMYDKDRERIFHLYELGLSIPQIYKIHLGYGGRLSLYRYIKKRIPFEIDKDITSRENLKEPTKRNNF